MLIPPLLAFEERIEHLVIFGKDFMPKRFRSYFIYLSHEMPYQRVICVLLFQTAVNVTDHRDNISSAQKMNHSIQNCFLELELKTTKNKVNYRQKK